jgi:hypothetical protein
VEEHYNLENRLLLLLPPMWQAVLLWRVLFLLLLVWF